MHYLGYLLTNDVDINEDIRTFGEHLDNLDPQTDSDIFDVEKTMQFVSLCSFTKFYLNYLSIVLVGSKLPGLHHKSMVQWKKV